MGQRILKSQSNALNNSLGQLDNFYQPIGSVVNVYKFRKVSGSIYLTRFGEKELEVDVNDYNQTFEVYTGKEPVVVVWEGSFKSWVDEQTDKIIKQYSVGEYEQCYLNEAQNIQNFNENINLYGKDYVMSMIKNNISLQSTTWNPDENDMRDYLYVILDKKTKCIKWLEITSITPVFNEETNNLQYVDINFETINNKYTKTGKSILDFIQLGAIGEGYAFPTEKTNSMGEIEVGYDLGKVIDIGVNSLQYDFTCGAANSSFLVIGRRKSKDIGNGKFEVDKPHLLWIYDIQYPLSSKFFYNQPNVNSYIGTKFQPTKEGIWKSYKENPSSNNTIGDYNILNTKEVLTGLKMVPNLNSIRNSNPNINTYINWKQTKDNNINFNGIDNSNPYYQQENEFNKLVSYAEFFNINSCYNFGSDIFNYDYKETTKYKLTDTLGILGGIVNILVGGLDIGWTTTQLISKQEQSLNLILPCISLEDGIAALNENAPLPLDVFMEDKSKSVLPTSTNVLTSWRFRLTDRVQDNSQVREGAELGKGKNGIWDLKYLGQTKFEDGTYINENKIPFKIKLSTTIPSFPSDNSFEFIIDYLDHHTISNSDYRITAYDSEAQSVYSAIMETNGKARGDIRIWGNSIKFNYYDKFNTTGQVKWPDTISPPKPDFSLIGFEIYINENEKNIFGIKLFDEVYSYEQAAPFFPGYSNYSWNLINNGSWSKDFSFKGNLETFIGIGIYGSLIYNCYLNFLTDWDGENINSIKDIEAYNEVNSLKIEQVNIQEFNTIVFYLDNGNEIKFPFKNGDINFKGTEQIIVDTTDNIKSVNKNKYNNFDLKDSVYLSTKGEYILMDLEAKIKELKINIDINIVNNSFKIIFNTIYKDLVIRKNTNNKAQNNKPLTNKLCPGRNAPLAISTNWKPTKKFLNNIKIDKIYLVKE